MDVMVSKVKLIVKWEKDEMANGYFIMQEVNNELKELVRIENTEITSVTISNLTVYQENHYIVCYYFKKNNDYVIFKQEDYYGYVDQKNYALYQFPIPKIIKIKKQKNTNIIEWENIADNVTYLIAKRTSGGKWERVGTTKKTNYSDTNIDAKTKYTYTIRCISEDGKRMLSSFSSKGVTI